MVINAEERRERRKRRRGQINTEITEGRRRYTEKREKRFFGGREEGRGNGGGALALGCEFVADQ